MTTLACRVLAAVLLILVVISSPQSAFSACPYPVCPHPAPPNPWDNLHEVLLAVPSEGRSGDTVDLSGSGFVPGYRVDFGIDCYYHGAVTMRGYSFGDAVPMVGRNGTFKGVVLRTTPGRPPAPATCQFYAEQPIDWHRGGFGPVPAMADYTLVARDAPVAWCATHICMTAAYHRLGNHDLLLVTGWPGATGNASVSVGKQYQRQFRLTFNWQGTAVLTLTHAARLRGKTATLTISAKLGDVTGTYSGSLRLGRSQSRRRA